MKVRRAGGETDETRRIECAGQLVTIAVGVHRPVMTSRAAKLCALEQLFATRCGRDVVGRRTHGGQRFEIHRERLDVTVRKPTATEPADRFAQALLQTDRSAVPFEWPGEIGRASCRERV